MGIGEAIASSLVEAGVNVILFSRSQVSPSPHPQSHQMIWLIFPGKKQDKLQQLQEKLSAKNNVKITYRAVDVGNYEEVDAAVSSSIKEMGDIDILINNVPTHYSQQKSTNIMTSDTHN